MFAIGVGIAFLGMLLLFSSESAGTMRQWSIVLAATGLVLLIAGPVLRLPLHRAGTWLNALDGVITVVAIAWFIDTLSGELRAEVNAYLPLQDDGAQVTIPGIINLLYVTNELVEIIDFKTVRDRRAQPEYRTQLSIYYYVAKSAFPDHNVSMILYYSNTGERVPLDPLDRAEVLAN